MTMMMMVMLRTLRDDGSQLSMQVGIGAREISKTNNTRDASRLRTQAQIVQLDFCGDQHSRDRTSNIARARNREILLLRLGDGITTRPLPEFFPPPLTPSCTYPLSIHKGSATTTAEVHTVRLTYTIKHLISALNLNMASRGRPSLADTSYPESATYAETTYAETYDEGSYASSSEGGGSAMLSRRAPSIQSAMSRRRFEEYSVTEPSLSKYLPTRQAL